MEMTMRTKSSFAILAATAGLFAMAATADARPTRAKAAGQNGSVTAIKGANGSGVRARGAVKNADGSVTSGRTGAFQTANGAKGARGSTTTINPDGSANRRTARGATGARGSYGTTSDVTRNADGTYSGGRSTNATSNATGNTYNGSTQIDPATGKPVRSATCTNASGAVIACPR
jgi:hypothetical protein